MEYCIAACSLDSTLCIMDPVSGTVLSTLQKGPVANENVLVQVGRYILTAQGSTLTCHLTPPLDRQLDALDPESFQQSNANNFSSSNGNSNSNSNSNSSSSSSSSSNANDLLSDPTFQWKSHVQEPITALAVTSDASFVIGGSHTGKVSIWMAATGSLLVVRHVHSREITSIKCSDEIVWSGCMDATVKQHSISQLLLDSIVNPLRILSQHTLGIKSLQYSNGWLVSVGADRQVHVWSERESAEVVSFSLPSQGTCAALSADTHTLVVGSVTGAMFVIQLYPFPPAVSDETVTSVDGHSAQVTSLQFNALGNRLISSSQDGSVRLWDTHSWTCVVSHDMRKNAVTVARFLDVYPTSEETEDENPVLGMLQKYPLEADAEIDASAVLGAESDESVAQLLRELRMLGGDVGDLQLDSVLQQIGGGALDDFSFEDEDVRDELEESRQQGKALYAECVHELLDVIKLTRQPSASSSARRKL
eukprot:ANDGO_05641.mRNA.1 Protein ROOT INITIATION DEFECTIVE 3